jgi:putative membrane protein
MKHLAWLFRTALKAAIFFTLFAFTLNNQSDVTVHFFFGRQWTGPLILVVLGAFCIGVMLGIVAMVPRWWRHRRDAAKARRALQPQSAASPAPQPVLPPDGI